MYYQTHTNWLAPETPDPARGSFNNSLAQAQADADPRFNLKQYDRPGMSRGAGTRAQAGIAAARSLSDGVARAYQIPMQDAVDSASRDLAYQQGREQLGLGASGLAMQADYSNALAALERQRQSMQFGGNALNGLMGGFNLDRFLGY